ncbi:hypothetical protein L0156_05925, partial [bacterium]|nr:hypothetical protein [bacterium]
AQVSILDDDHPIVSITASDPNASEQGPDNGQFTIARTGETTASLTVQLRYGAIEGDATAGSDFQTPRPAITIPAGQPSVAFNIIPIDDSLQEATENVRATVVASSDYDIASPGSATIGISDND